MRRSIFEPEHEALRATAKEFLDRHVRPRMDEFIEAKGLPRDVWIEAGKQGLLGLHVPEQYGGGEAGDYRFIAVVAEEQSKVSAAISSCLGIHADIVAPYLIELTTEEQRERWLPGFCTGEIVTAIAMTEPSGGSDLANLRTTAVRDGDDYILNGSKTFITNGYSADLVVVAARTDPEKGAKGITLFGVEAGMEGFSRGRKLDKVGQTESDTAELFFTNVRVPAANVIGEVDRGLHPHDGAPGAGARRRGGEQHRPGGADPRGDDRVHQGAQGLRPVRRLVPAQQVQDRRAGHAGRGHAGVRRQLRDGAHRGQAVRRRRRRRPSGGRPRCRTTSSTSACSCTAATAS